MLSYPEQRICTLKDICPTEDQFSCARIKFLVFYGIGKKGIHFLNKRFASLSLAEVLCVFVTGCLGGALTFILKAYENSFPARYVLQFLPGLGRLFIDTLVNVKVNLYSLYTGVKAASYEFYFTSLSFQNCSLNTPSANKLVIFFLSVLPKKKLAGKRAYF